ncbi:transforming growth factor beta-1-induced transcript 1 protein-like isoform X4 [Mixophyes fleayi]|uniref:transforming growth factor beta-1-induced transcript 1 protein-like isoform X4 n=1 Tax=Mixophyes fleayi TaxID=3061075 RepID=UPI003F4D851C
MSCDSLSSCLLRLSAATEDPAALGRVLSELRSRHVSRAGGAGLFRRRGGLVLLLELLTVPARAATLGSSRRNLELALSLLANSCTDSGSRVQVRQLGGIPALVCILQSVCVDSIWNRVTRALGNLALDPQNNVIIHESDFHTTWLCTMEDLDSHEQPETGEQRPPPPPYDPKTAITYTSLDLETFPGDKNHLYSTVKKYAVPSVSTGVGGGLCELDRLLNELNATQFNITDEIMSQFPPRDKEVTERPEERRVLSASSATLELDRLMASLSDFHKQNTVSVALQGLEACSPGTPVEGESQLSPSTNHGTVTDPGGLKSVPVLSSVGTNKPSIEALNSRRPEDVSSPQCLEPDARSDLDSMMVTLQSGLKQQGIETQTKGLCEGCQRPIAGQVVTALGHTWHPEHFVCAHCKSLIGSTNFFEKDGQPYCERDYFTLHAPRCALCDLPILQNLVTALGRTWHPEHFCCKICRKQIGEEGSSSGQCAPALGFHEKEGEPYCSDDYFRLFGAVCAGCSDPVKESYISALNGLWHPQCFVCHVCHTPFLNGSFFENDGLPLCETHYHSCRGSLCAGCDQPITGRCVTAMGRKFHPQHLSCTFCLRQLNKGTFREQDGKPYCQACFARLYG